MTPGRAIILLALGQTIVWAGTYYLFPSLLLRWEAAEGWPKTTLTAAIAGALIVSGLVAPLMGRWIDRGHGPLLMTLSALGGAVLVGCLPLVGRIEVFGLVWLLIGVAMAGCLYEPCFALITRTRGNEARRSITLVTLIAGFAGTVSFPVNHGVAEVLGWQGATVTFALLIACVGAPSLWFGGRYLERTFRALPVPEGQNVSTNTGQVAKVLRSPVFWGLAAGFSIMGLVHGVVLGHLLPIMHDRGVAAGTAVLAASMIGPMQVMGRLAMMVTERHISSHAITTASLVAVGIAVTALLFADVSPALIVVFVVLQGSGYGITSIMRPVILREVMGEQNFGAISGVMAMPYLLAAALAPFFGSLLWEAGGYDLALQAMVGFSLMGLCAYRFAAWKSGR